ncbi:hypothetical protein HanPSC8_Chr02g0063241 [Helianthus annuus]|nr:hypothetical protein HanPSC8_Chr02g0063241 [Helianthus annuus]
MMLMIMWMLTDGGDDDGVVVVRRRYRLSHVGATTVEVVVVIVQSVSGPGLILGSVKPSQHWSKLCWICFGSLHNESMDGQQKLTGQTSVKAVNSAI